ncbi:hypothetical protein OKW76_00440 [Sphingomonas sp. S1-29]|uniref:hypothetical protein n=1 Tax=Sphingomonas sp. S1-29 TaxID=2991074 RepID=UPI0022406946|nr:hypothetical protein [Sphingomonas sp. S1-29]UZK69593.1 hypothetical protein OKW76_00440 [Sphingomonas sp. S1-29]
MTDETPNTELRKPNGQFAKGVNGRKLAGKPSQKATVEDILDSNAIKVAQMLIKIILDPDTAGGPRVAAIKEFGDRWLGRPSQTTIVRKSDNELDEVDLSGLDDETLRKVVYAPTKKDS